MAASDLFPAPGKPLIESDAGSYVAWTGPAIAGEKLGCGLLVLKPLGMAMPHYADCSKVCYILEGTVVAGLVPAGETRERVVRLDAGDVILVRSGDITWWYNDDGAAELSMLLLGDTAASLHPGKISYFLLTGATNLLEGFDAGVLATAWGLTSHEQAAAAFRSQPRPMLTKLAEKLHGVVHGKHDRHGLVVSAAAHAAAGGITVAEMPALGELGFSVGLARLEAGAVRAPWVLREGAVQAVYVTRGSGRVQVSGTGAPGALDVAVTAGSLFVVPRFAVACVAAGADGMEWVAFIKSPRPVVEKMTGKGSVVGCMTTAIVQAALNVAPEFVELLGNKR